MRKKSFLGLSVIALSMFMFSCKDELGTVEKTDNPVAAEPLMKAGNVDLPGRLLASNCFQCHGTNGYAGELKIAGEGASEIISELNEMKAKDPRSDIMNAHARAYTDEEIKIIADYISKQ